MASVLGNYLGNKILYDYFTSQTLWLAIHQADPTAVGDLSTEFGGGGYRRQSIRFGPPSNRTVVSINAQTYTSLLPGVALYLAVWTEQVRGHLHCTMQVAAVSIPESGQYLVSPGDIAIAI